MLQRERWTSLFASRFVWTRRPPNGPLAGDPSQAHRPPAPRPHRRGRQIHRAPGRLQIRLRGHHPRRHRQRLRGGYPTDRRGGHREARGGYLQGLGGILVPGGFGERGIEGKIRAARYAREHHVPYLGLCLGMQIATIEFARNVLKLAKAHSTEFNPARRIR